MLAALILTIALHRPPHAKAPDALGQIERWIDTLGNDNSFFREGASRMRSMERMHNEKGPHCDPFPTYYRSPWRKPHVNA